MAAGQARTETQRRARVMHGWAFRTWTPEEKKHIARYLALQTDVPPAGYERLHANLK